MTKFNVKFSDYTYGVVADLAGKLEVSMADVIREALSLFWWIAREHMSGSRLLVQRGDEVTELVIPTLERLRSEGSPIREVVPSEVVVASAGRRSRAGRRRPAAPAES